MDRRVALGAVVAAAVLAALALALLAPGVGPDPEPARPRAVEAPAPVAAAPSPAPVPRPKLQVEAPRPAAPAVQGPLGMPRVAPRPPVDADKVHEAAFGGIGEALFTRQPRLLSCYSAHVAKHGPVRGRPVIRATVLADGDEGLLDIGMENDGEGIDELQDCMAGAMADARFEAPEVPITMLHPLPVPSFRP